MILDKQTIYTKDLENKKMTVVREFAAPVEKVWAAWTDSKLLDKWWAPKPYRAKTKFQDFREGGYWLYSMVGPDNVDMWARVDYKTISPLKNYTAIDAFCDEEGNPNTDFLNMHWSNEFKAQGDTTKVTVEITFEALEDMEKIIEMGFQEGFAMGHTNLDELLASGF